MFRFSLRQSDTPLSSATRQRSLSTTRGDSTSTLHSSPSTLPFAVPGTSSTS
jgi:hypothetical protein